MTSTSFGAPARALHEMPEIRARRWFLLGIMCLSLVRRRDVRIGSRDRDPDDAAGARRVGIADPVGARLVCRRVRGLAPHRRCARRPVRPQARAVVRPRRLRGRRAPRRRRVDCFTSDRRPSGHGHRRRVRDARDVVDHHDDLPARGANARHRGVGGLRRRGWRTRADRVGGVARGVLVGLGGARESSDRRRDIRRDLDVRARVTRRNQDAARPCRCRALTRGA